ncbi:MAG TPA: hypothetical protein VKW09_13405 [bacterium]|nr:hypothetical protein [bacterium]
MTSSIGLRLCAALTLAALLAAAPARPGAAQGPSAPPLLPIAVTGGPATLDTLRLAITTAARLALGYQTSSAVVTVADTQPPLVPLDASAAETVTAGLTVTAAGAPPVTHVVRVALTNAIIPWNDAETLLVSNSPETIPLGKVLYTGALSAAQTVRLLFHHQNGSKEQHMFLTVTLSNPSRDPAAVWVQGAIGGPSQDEVTPGHDAARIFLVDYVHHAGFLVRLPGNTTVPLFVVDLPPLGITSGIMQAGLLDGARLNVQVAARLATEADPPMMSYEPDFDRIHQRGAFVRPQIGRTVAYTVGGPLAVMDIAVNADLLHEGQTGTLLQGNYGVVYRFDINLDNPTPAPAIAVLVLHAAGGQARGTFLIGDQVVESPLVQPYAPQVIFTLPLPAQTRRSLRILTVPESGSNYPVKLTLGAP